MDGLQAALDLVHSAIAASEPESEIQKRLTEAQRSLLEYIWADTVRADVRPLRPQR